MTTLILCGLLVLLVWARGEARLSDMRFRRDVFKGMWIGMSHHLLALKNAGYPVSIAIPTTIGKDGVERPALPVCVDDEWMPWKQGD